MKFQEWWVDFTLGFLIIVLMACIAGAYYYKMEDYRSNKIEIGSN